MPLSIAYVTALALVFGANAGSSWAEDITTQITNQGQITNTDDTSYNITSASGNGIYANDTDIYFGGGATGSIDIDASGSNAYGIRTNSSSDNASVELTVPTGTIETEAAARGVGSIASGNNYSASIGLTAGVDNILSGEIYGISSRGSSGGCSSITLKAGESNQVQATDSTRNGAGIYSNSYDSYSSVSLTAETDNTVNGNKYGIYSYNSNGTPEVSLMATKGTHTVTSASDYAISSIGGGGGQSEVSLSAGQNNVVKGANGINSSSSTGSSKVTLEADSGNNTVSASSYGISSYNGSSAAQK